LGSIKKKYYETGDCLIEAGFIEKKEKKDNTSDNAFAVL